MGGGGTGTLLKLSRKEGTYVNWKVRLVGRYKVRSFVPSFVPLACASQPRGRFRLVAKSSLSCVGRLLATLAGWLWMRFFCDRRRRRRLRNAASDAGPLTFIFWSVHYPSVRSKSKERTSLSVVSLLLPLLLVKFVLEL
jgi:hypothetical protein